MFKIKEAYASKACLAIILICFLANLYGIYRNITSHNQFIFADYLINYTGGFVRRGIFGEIVSKLIGLQNTDHVTYFILAFNFAVSTLFFLSIFLIYRKSDSKTLLLSFLLFPISVAFYGFDIFLSGRKEQIFLAVYTYLLATGRINSKFDGRIALSATAIFGLLYHESILLFSSIIYWVTLSQSREKNYHRSTNVLFLLNLIILTVTLIFFKTKSDYQLFCESVTPFFNGACNGQISIFNNYDPSHEVVGQFLLGNFEHLYFNKIFPFIAVLTLIIIGYTSELTGNMTYTRKFKLTLPVITVVALHLGLGDFGRWLHVYFVCAILTLAQFEDKFFVSALPKGSISGHSLYVLIYSSLLWNIWIANINYFNFGALGRITGIYVN